MSLLKQFFVYHPEPWQDRDWAKLSGLPLEDISFWAADGARLFVWYVETRADRRVMLWCHGNARNIIHCLDNLKLLHQLGLSVFIFDYRGYGKSQKDNPCEKGLYHDTIVVYDYSKGKRNENRRVQVMVEANRRLTFRFEGGCAIEVNFGDGHSGISVRGDCTEPHGLSETEGAKILGVSFSWSRHLVNRRVSWSRDMAIRLAKAFGSVPDI